MLDIKNLRDNFKDIQISLKKRGYDLNEASFKSLDDSRKELQIEVENLQAERKKLSSEFGELKASGEETSDLKKVIDKINSDLEKKDSELQEVLKNLNNGSKIAAATPGLSFTPISVTFASFLVKETPLIIFFFDTFFLRIAINIFSCYKLFEIQKLMIKK